MFLVFAIVVVLSVVFAGDFLIFRCRGTGKSDYKPADLIKGYRCRSVFCRTKDPSLIAPDDAKVRAIPGAGPKQCYRCQKEYLEIVHRKKTFIESVRMAFGLPRILTNLGIALVASLAAMGLRLWIGEPSIGFAPELNFQFVTVGERNTREFVVQNIGTGTLKVSFTTAADRQVTVSPSELRIPAGSSGFVTVSFVPAAAGSMRTKIKLKSNSVTPPVADGVAVIAEAGLHGTWWVFDELKNTSKIFSPIKPPP